ncbi:phage integrase central domain-containing protein [Streptomyces sp. NPDC001492]
MSRGPPPHGRPHPRPLVQDRNDRRRKDHAHHIDPRTARTTFRQYAERWVNSHTGEINSREAAERRLRLHAYPPHIGTRPLDSFKPEHIRAWIAALEDTVPAESHRRIIVGTVSAALSAAVDDGLLSKNPCQARTMQLPKPGKPRVVPWTAAHVFDVRSALQPRFRATVDPGAGCGLRQGEIFGLSVDELNCRVVTHSWMRHVIHSRRMRDGRLSIHSGRHTSMITAPGRPGRSAAPTASSKRPGHSPAEPDHADFIYFWPLYTGTAIPIDDWRSRMWLDTWV